MKKKYVLCLFFLSITFIFSCGPDDSVTPLNIITNPDAVQLNQNSEIEIFIFQNDLNIPVNGSLSVTNASKGFVLINDNDSPNNTTDDSVVFTANPNVVGDDTFSYTVCDDFNNCKTEIVNISIASISNVVVDLADLPYQNLTQYNFFQNNIKDLVPNFGVIPYTLNSTLFTDYSKKKRFIWMPVNTKATYLSDDTPLDFPVGTILIKNFYYDNVLPENITRIIETRLMIRKDEGWQFANYVWNTDQNEAILDLEGSFTNLQWLEDGEVNSVQYRIPAGPECHTCHKVMEIPQPIGPKPRNLNLDYQYNDGLTNQLEKLISFGYLDNSLPENVSRLPDYNNVAEPLELRVRAYLDINCAHCHSEETHCAYRPMRLNYIETEDLINIGVCVEPDTDLGEGLGRIVEPGDARNSVLHFRLNTTEQSNRMPLLGRTIVHTEGVNLIEEWIDNLNTDCN